MRVTNNGRSTRIRSRRRWTMTGTACPVAGVRLDLLVGARVQARCAKQTLKESGYAGLPSSLGHHRRAVENSAVCENYFSSTTEQGVSMLTL
jgi:hypothetical protein